MEPLKFKTNIKCSACVAKVTPTLNEKVGEGKWQVDLTNPNRTLTIETETPAAEIKEALLTVGYQAETLNP
jgi:copper chaperone